MSNAHFLNYFRLSIFLIVTISKDNTIQMNPNEVNQIVVQCREGSKEAFQRLVREYQNIRQFGIRFCLE